MQHLKLAAIVNKTPFKIQYAFCESYDEMSTAHEIPKTSEIKLKKCFSVNIIEYFIYLFCIVVLDIYLSV